MVAADSAQPKPRLHATRVRWLRANWLVLLPALVVVGLMLVWAAHNGGYDAITWYWGALVLLGICAVMLIVLGARRQRADATRGDRAVAHSAATCSGPTSRWRGRKRPGGRSRAATGRCCTCSSSRCSCPSLDASSAASPRSSSIVLGVGVIAIVLLLRLASSDHIQNLAIDGRLAAPTGYFNSSVALFMTTPCWQRCSRRDANCRACCAER